MTPLPSYPLFVFVVIAMAVLPPLLALVHNIPLRLAYFFISPAGPAGPAGPVGTSSGGPTATAGARTGFLIHLLIPGVFLRFGDLAINIIL